MRQATIDRVQAGIWRKVGDYVEVFAPGGDVDADDPIWSGLAIRLVPTATDTPGETQSYQQPVRGFSFRLWDVPRLPQDTIIRYADVSWTVDEILDSGDDQISVAVFPV